VLVRRLRERGAFVVYNSDRTADSDHLHHFPLRATVRPRQGRLICVDLADYLHTWRPGRDGDLHVLPFGLDSCESVGRGCALNILFHFDPSAPGPTLDEVDHYASRYRELILESDGDVVFTTADRLDGRAGSLDLLVIQEAI
jgi:hypothetical protein